MFENFENTLRTTLLLGLLTGIFLAIGYAFAGASGMTYALILALIMNFIAYWFSDKIVLSMYGAKQITEPQNPALHRMVKKLCGEANLPMPRLYKISDKSPNAFATGRNPKNAAIAVTAGLMETLNDDEVEGVLAHEISHIKNHDILVSSLAATIAGAITYLVQLAYFTGSRGNGERKNGMEMLLMMILAPMAAALVRMAISRRREFGADKTGAALSKNPEGLASALQKIASASTRTRLRGNQATAHMFIVNPFSGTLGSLFSTHPPVEERIRILKAMKI
ncbi:MAG: zinc metalloprotease HtpX [Candidatus Aenigmatarchaeota archaeon]